MIYIWSYRFVQYKKFDDTNRRKKNKQTTINLQINIFIISFFIIFHTSKIYIDEQTNVQPRYLELGQLQPSCKKCVTKINVMTSHSTLDDSTLDKSNNSWQSLRLRLI